MDQQQFNDLHPKVVLGIAAHPDDLDFGASGTMARFANEGADVHYLIITDGSQGSSDPKMTGEELAKIRQEEQRQALEKLGSKPDNVTFLGYKDGGLEVTMEAKKDVVKVIRMVKPDVVVTMDPTFVYSAKRGAINHPDHRAAGQLALDAVYPLARDHMAFPELYKQGYLPHKVKTVLLTNFEKHNFIVDITKTIDKKIEALVAHSSQIANIDEMAERIKGWAAILGKEYNYKYAEGFMRIDLNN